MPPGLRRRVFEAILAEEAGQPLPNGGPPSFLTQMKATLGRLFRGGP